MISGRKLLLADDSIAIQKVVDLTFTDEGMDVTIVGDGDDALEKLNQLAPDVVLADVFMPGVDGYELCQFIKQSAQFSQVPVMLLVGSFEPFDEAEAQRVGADDVVIKPFQSIRQLVSRVGSLIGEGKSGEDKTQSYSTLGLEGEAPRRDMTEDEQSQVRVFVEAPVMSETDLATADEHTYPPDIDLQTADTRKLEPIDPAATDIADTIEVEVVAVGEEQDSLAETARSEGIEEGVLDLGDVDTFVSTRADDDFVLDLDVESGETASVRQPVAESSPPANPEAKEMNTEAASAKTQGWPIVSHSVQQNTSEVEATASRIDTGNLSPGAIDAISRRVVEQLSDKVVREIAWEVVPELSELLIKERLNKRD